MFNSPLKISCKECSATTCPFAFSEESETIQNYGCLPTPFEIMDMRINQGKTWACHSNPRKPCLGALMYLKNEGKPYKVIDPRLITERDQWDLYLSNSKFTKGDGILSISSNMTDKEISSSVRQAIKVSKGHSFKVRAIR